MTLPLPRLRGSHGFAAALRARFHRATHTPPPPRLRLGWVTARWLRTPHVTAGFCYAAFGSLHTHPVLRYRTPAFVPHCLLRSGYWLVLIYAVVQFAAWLYVAWLPGLVYYAATVYTHTVYPFAAGSRTFTLRLVCYRTRLPHTVVAHARLPLFVRGCRYGSHVTLRSYAPPLLRLRILPVYGYLVWLRLLACRFTRFTGCDSAVGSTWIWMLSLPTHYLLDCLPPHAHRTRLRSIYYRLRSYVLVTPLFYTRLICITVLHVSGLLPFTFCLRLIWLPRLHTFRLPHAVLYGCRLLRFAAVTLRLRLVRYVHGYVCSVPRSRCGSCLRFVTVARFCGLPGYAFCSLRSAG